MSYAVKEIFLTLQGEGVQCGRRAVFCRFSGCNLWTGRERHRATAVCRFCDTDFVGTDGTDGGRYADADALADRIETLWDGPWSGRFVVLTGGEPLLQVDAVLLDGLHARGFTVAVETNGTVAAPPGIDWLCVSPKAGGVVVQRSGDELKLVWPQADVDLDELESWAFTHRLIQPMDGPPDTLALATALVMARPAWRLSLQTHKLLGIR